MANGGNSFSDSKGVYAHNGVKHSEKAWRDLM